MFNYTNTSFANLSPLAAPPVAPSHFPFPVPYDTTTATQNQLAPWHSGESSTVTAVAAIPSPDRVRQRVKVIQVLQGFNEKVE
jgi:hypothetical protein